VRHAAFLVSNPVDRLSWLLIAGTIAVVLAWLPFAPFSLAVSGIVGPAAGTLGLLAGAWIYTMKRPDAGLAAALVHAAQMAAFTAFGSILSYLIAAQGLPFWDAALHRADLALGLDWRAYLGFVNDRPLLGLVYTAAYQSLIPQMLVLILVLSLSGRLRDVRVMMCAAILTGLATVIGSGLMPAMAMFVHLGLTPADFPNLQPAAAFVHVADMTALRSGAMTVLDISTAEGIVTFPSYHAALGLILLIAGWSHPWLRWPFFVVNVLLIAATPIDGGHYFVDVACGLALAALAVAVASRMAGPSAAAAMPARAAPQAQAA
jgi:membrane-associated phospholipid phosphatase